MPASAAIAPNFQPCAKIAPVSTLVEPTGFANEPSDPALVFAITIPAFATVRICTIHCGRALSKNKTQDQILKDISGNRGKTSGRSGCRAGSADEFREVGDGSVSGDIEPGTEIIPEGDAELGAGFGEAEEGI